MVSDYQIAWAAVKSEHFLMCFSYVESSMDGEIIREWRDGDREGQFFKVL